MLELRPNCEYCDKDLPPDSTDARICTNECTFCTACAEDVLDNVCPNCGGGFEARPLRPAIERRPRISDGIYALAAGGLGDRLRRSPAVSSGMRWLSGGVYIALGTATAISGGSRSSP